MQTYCMGMAGMSATALSMHTDILHSQNAVLNSEVLKKAHVAVRKAHIDSDPTLENNEVLDIAVSYNGTWHKRGHSSLYGLGLVIDILTGLVIDFELLSRYCAMCCQNKKKNDCRPFCCLV